MSRSPKRSSNTTVMTSQQFQGSRELQWVERLTHLLDNRYRIPGTNIRFGGDFLMGLVPGAGDLLSLGFSGAMIVVMAKNGASGLLVIRMLGNVLLDALVGSVPVLGNFFDLFYKANYRNLKLLREHYEEGKHRGSVWPVVLLVLVAFAAVFAFAAFLIVLLIGFLWNLGGTIWGA